MTKGTRYFLFGTLGVLLVGLSVGLVAYLTYTRAGALPAGLPAELRYVPANAEAVAYADVQALMNSELRKQLMPAIEGRSHKGQQMMNDFAGIDVEKQVHHVVAYAESSASRPATDGDATARHEMPRAVVLVQGTFDEARVAQFVGDRGGEMQEYQGRKVFVAHRDGKDEKAVGFVAPGLMAIGEFALVRRAIDRARTGSAAAPDITTNADMMKLVRDSAGTTAWVVGQFDAVRRHMQLPAAVGSRVPPVRFISVNTRVNGAIRATIRAEAGDKAAADELRDVVRGFVSLARIQGNATPQFESMLKSIELSGTDTTVQLSLALAPDTLAAIARHRRPPASPDPSSAEPAK